MLSRRPRYLRGVRNRRSYATLTRRRGWSAAPRAGEPLAVEAGEDVPSAPPVLRRILALPPVKMVLRGSIDVSSDGSGVIGQFGVCTDPSGTFAGSVFPAGSGWSSLATLFDLYKPEYCVIEWFPLRPNDPTATTAYYPIAVCFDPDSGSNPSSFSEITQYSNARVFNIHKAFRYATRIPRRAGAAVAGYLDVGTPNGEPASFRWYADSLTASVAYGRMVVSFVVRMKSSR